MELTLWWERRATEIHRTFQRVTRSKGPGRSTPHWSAQKHTTHMNEFPFQNEPMFTLETHAFTASGRRGTGRGHLPHPWPRFSDAPGSEPSPSHTACCFQPETWCLPHRGCRWSQLMEQTRAVSKMWCTRSREYYLIKRNEVLKHVKTWINLKSFTISEICQTQKGKYCMIPLL